MGCVVCSQPDKYRCPKCKSRYCSVSCFKKHNCVDINTQQIQEKQDPVTDLNTLQTANETLITPNSVDPNDLKYLEMLKDPQISALISDKSVKEHLKLIAQIHEDPQISKEQSTEGRRFVALKKIRELRKGGREANESIEELAQAASNYAEQKHES